MSLLAAMAAAYTAVALLANMLAQTFTVCSMPRARSSISADVPRGGRLRGGVVAAQRCSSCSSSLAPASLMLAVSAAAAAALRRRHCKSLARRANVAQWKQRVRRIEGSRAIFDVTIPKPLGLVPKNFPNRPGVGVAKIKEDGNTDLLNKRVLLDDEEGMWVLEGDEVIAVNDVLCEGKDLEEVSLLVKAAKGDSIKLTLCRNTLSGPVKIIWKPSMKMATYNRKAILRTCEENLGARVRYSCEDGWCSSCWHAEEKYLTVFRICKHTVPKDWDNVMPFVLCSALEIKNTKGLLVQNLMQSDGVKPPRQDK
eukprot:TRINITY_DN48872_c0_g1_i1.p1 TRINITY_DN48872_c0_g1~~TRINITY_DN48872_c0_g1_i1.p1  ORF type:complete len:339 (+),score=64.52 TRINITY_DN48872_c0_g1_i1:87-1019(+)